MDDPIVLKDESSGSAAHIAAQIGFNCYAFRARVGDRAIEVLDADPEFVEGSSRPSGHGIPILFPFPNRIRGGRYSWDGRDYQLSPENVSFDPTGNAIHGFCLDRPWRVVQHGPRFAVGEFQLSVDAPDRQQYWPADFVIQVRYELSGASLRADIRVSNPSDKPLPWGFGTHPYFRLPLGEEGTAASVLIEAPASEEWELVDCLPTGNRKPVSEAKDLRDGAEFQTLKLDDVLTGLQPQGSAVEFTILDPAAGLQVVQRCDPIFRELVVYTPPNRDAVCLEPYTCPTDAINLQQQGIDTGWQVLPPGGEFRTWIEIRAGQILA